MVSLKGKAEFECFRCTKRFTEDDEHILLTDGGYVFIFCKQCRNKVRTFLKINKQRKEPQHAKSCPCGQGTLANSYYYG